MSNEQESMEGFICPICMVDLYTLSLLMKHFESSHAEDRALLDQLKGFFDKAKDKLNIAKSESLSSISNDNSSSEIKEECNVSIIEVWSKQKLGKSIDHMELFISQRRSKIDFMVIEANKTMIRLQKISEIDVKSYEKRKEREQFLVPWAPDDACTICMICGLSFQMLLLKLRHHCRICGCAICHDCSQFLPLKNAYKIVANEVMERHNDLFVYEALTSEYGIRMCRMCRAIIDSQSIKASVNNINEIFTELYEKLADNMLKATENFDQFLELNRQLKDGHGSFNETNLIKERVINLNDNVNALRFVTAYHLRRRESRIALTPIMEQIDIIKGYIRKAQQAGKVDDLAMLKKNLRDLEEAGQ